VVSFSLKHNRNRKGSKFMKMAWLTIVCATCTMLSASSRAQTESSDPSSQSQSSQSQGASASSEQSWSSRHMSATGRQSQPVRGSKLMGAQVKDSSGSQIGQIEDIIASPASGRIDFAVISLSSSGTTTSTSSHQQCRPEHERNCRYDQHGQHERQIGCGSVVPAENGLLRQFKRDNVERNIFPIEQQHRTAVVHADDRRPEQTATGAHVQLDRPEPVDLATAHVRILRRFDV
jgi:sporulation protein YlmC with PRC-barrel domain